MRKRGCLHNDVKPEVEHRTAVAKTLGGERHEDIEVVIRSVGERTETALANTVLRSVDKLTIVRGFTLQEATQLAGEIARNSSRPYFLSLDADIILSPVACDLLRDSISSADDGVQRVTGKSRDQFITREGPRAGFFIARTPSMGVWADVGSSPSFTPDADMSSWSTPAQHRTRIADDLALHGYGQYYCHLSRSHFVSGYRLSRFARAAPRFCVRALFHMDFRAATLGALEGLTARLRGRAEMPPPAPTARSRRYCLVLQKRSHVEINRRDKPMSDAEASGLLAEVFGLS